MQRKRPRQGNSVNSSLIYWNFSVCFSSSLVYYVVSSLFWSSFSVFFIFLLHEGSWDWQRSRKRGNGLWRTCRRHNGRSEVSWSEPKGYNSMCRAQGQGALFGSIVHVAELPGLTSRLIRPVWNAIFFRILSELDIFLRFLQNFCEIRALQTCIVEQVYGIHFTGMCGMIDQKATT